MCVVDPAGRGEPVLARRSGRSPIGHGRAGRLPGCSDGLLGALPAAVGAPTLCLFRGSGRSLGWTEQVAAPSGERRMAWPRLEIRPVQPSSSISRTSAMAAGSKLLVSRSCCAPPAAALRWTSPDVALVCHDCSNYGCQLDCVMAPSMRVMSTSGACRVSSDSLAGRGCRSARPGTAPAAAAGSGCPRPHALADQLRTGRSPSPCARGSAAPGRRARPGLLQLGSFRLVIS
jgi:hypothetical protein